MLLFLESWCYSHFRGSQGTPYASVVEGVEDANDADVSEVTTRQVPEDDVPDEYLNDEDEHVA